MTWVSLILKVIGIWTFLSRWLERRAAREQGKLEQKSADDTKTIEDARRAQKIDSDVDRMSHGELVGRLSKYKRRYK